MHELGTIKLLSSFHWKVFHREGMLVITFSYLLGQNNYYSAFWYNSKKSLFGARMKCITNAISINEKLIFCFRFLKMLKEHTWKPKHKKMKFDLLKHKSFEGNNSDSSRKWGKRINKKHTTDKPKNFLKLRSWLLYCNINCFSSSYYLSWNWHCHYCCDVPHKKGFKFPLSCPSAHL